MQNPLTEFKNDSDSFLSPSIAMPSISPEQLGKVIQRAKVTGFNVNQVGLSSLGRPIHLLTMGGGEIKIFAWSQMHGDEATATAALIDLIELLGDDTYAKWCDGWRDRITLHLLPMLNPDGAVKSTRHNAQGIDINRDARMTQSPEGRILKSLIDEISPDVAFNLHDQSRYYGVGDKKTPATLSFLVPPGDEHNTITSNRQAAMALVSLFIQHMQPYLGDCMGKYQDEYSKRAFGDYASSQGASCVLIESGASATGKLRTQARKMNLLAFLLTLEHLGNQELLTLTTEPYMQLPLNNEGAFTDVLIKGVTVTLANGENYIADIAIDVPVATGNSMIREIGDLADLQGFEVVDGSGLRVFQGTIVNLQDRLVLTKEKYLELLRAGTLFFSGKTHLLVNESGLPIISEQNSDNRCQQSLLGQSGTLLLGNEEHFLFAILNGTVVDLRL